VAYLELACRFVENILIPNVVFKTTSYDGLQDLNMTESVDSLIVGGGVIGLAIARELALAGREVVVVELEPMVGSGVSSRNSEVIHAGIYYPSESLKARMCVRGKQQLYQYCDRCGVSYKRIGKLIIATSDAELSRLQELLKQGQSNGVGDLVPLTDRGIGDLEPSIVAKGALYSPSTGIIDSHGFIQALKGDIESANGFVVTNTAFKSGEVIADGFKVTTMGEELYSLHCRTLINAAGLAAQSVAKNIIGLKQTLIPKQYLAKGNYFSLVGTHDFSHLVYPVPESGGLGIHATLDLSGQVKFGPDVEWVTSLNYDVDPHRAQKFIRAIRSYWPDISDDALLPDYAGIRPKLVGPNQGAADFIIQTEKAHGIPRLVNLFGIESPGLTSSLAIAEYVRKLLV